MGRFAYCLFTDWSEFVAWILALGLKGRRDDDEEHRGSRELSSSYQQAKVVLNDNQGTYRISA